MNHYFPIDYWKEGLSEPQRNNNVRHIEIDLGMSMVPIFAPLLAFSA